jgi:hypothetical protein
MSDLCVRHMFLTLLPTLKPVNHLEIELFPLGLRHPARDTVLFILAVFRSWYHRLDSFSVFLEYFSRLAAIWADQYFGTLPEKCFFIDEPLMDSWVAGAWFVNPLTSVALEQG